MDDRIEIAYILDRPCSEEEIKTLFEALVDHRFRSQAEEDLDIAYWDDAGDTHTLSGSPGQAASVCVQHGSVAVTIAFEEFRLRIGPNSDRGAFAEIPHLTVDTQIHPFTESEADSDRNRLEERRQKFADTLADIAAKLEPIWAFGRRGGVTFDASVSIGDLASSPSPPLYEYNVFNAETVDSIGRERVISSPAWHVEELETGAVLLVVRAPPLSCSPQEPTCKAVADHLGMDLIEPTRYH